MTDMPLRKIGRALASIFRAQLGMETSLLTIQQQGNSIIMDLKDLKAASAAEAGAVTSVLAAVLALQAQHQEDLTKLAALTPSEDNAGEIAALTSALQARATSITDTLSTLHANMTSYTDTVTGAGSDTLVSGTSDSVAGAAGSDTIAAGTADSIAGADTGAGAGISAAL